MEGLWEQLYSSRLPVAVEQGERAPSNGRTISLQGCFDTSAARYRYHGMGSGRSTWVRRATSRRVDAGEGDERQQGRHTVQQRFDGAGTREVEENTVLVLFNLGRHFAEGEDHGRGLGLGQRSLLECLGQEDLMHD